MDNKVEYSKQLRISQINLFIALIGFIFALYAFISSEAALVVLNLILAISCIVRNLLLITVSSRLQKNLTMKYNYGVGKIEDMVSLIVNTITMIGIGISMYMCIKDVLFPETAAVPELSALISPAFFVFTDILIYFKQRKLVKASPTPVFQAELKVAFQNIFSDAAMALGILIILIFGNHYVSIWLSFIEVMIIGTYTAKYCIKDMFKSFANLLDKTLDEDIQLKILKVLTRYDDKYSLFNSVDSRKSGGVLQIDLCLLFDDNTSFGEIKMFSDHLRQDLTEELGECFVNLKL